MPLKKIFGSEKKAEGSFYSLLACADETYGNLPMSVRVEIEKISQGLTEFGPRKLSRSGPGTEFFQAREFRDIIDDPRKVNARLSARHGKRIIVEKEAEIRQHFYLWRDPSASMIYASDPSVFTKKEASEIMLLAFAKHLARNEELIGMLDQKGTHRGGSAADSLVNKLLDVTIVTGDLPQLNRKLPRHSIAVMFSDFMMEKDELVKGLDSITGNGLKGFVVMVLDPQEIEFKFKGHVEFNGLENEGDLKVPKAQTLKNAYKVAIGNHINMVEDLCKAKGFKFILQRTDRPLHHALLEIYGLSPNSPEQEAAPILGAP